MKLPRTLTSDSRNDPIDAFAYEAAHEAAIAIGRIGRELEAALEAIRRHDATPGANTDREDLLHDAAEKAMALIIQREAFGLRASQDIRDYYEIPGDVMVRIGVVRKPRHNNAE